MTGLTRNTVFDRVREAGPMTDAELYKSLTKDGTVLSPDRFNKMLLDLEILGLIRVAWVTKDDKRIEVCAAPEGPDAVDEEAKRAEERDYEASFPGLEK